MAGHLYSGNRQLSYDQLELSSPLYHCLTLFITNTEANMKLQDLTLQHKDGMSFIQLPNGDVIELTICNTGKALYVDHRESLGADSLGALSVEL